MFLDDEDATARIRRRRARSGFWVAVTAVTACVVMMTALAGTARAEDVSHISQVIAPQLLLDGGPSADSRLLFGVLTVVFSMAAAGLWFWSFRGTAGHRTRNHGKRISQS
jgi:hypothetical protein